MFKKYDNYKDSGLEWLGDIPSEWGVKRNKHIFTESSQLSSTGNEMLLTVSHITGVTPRSEKNVNMFFAKTMEGYKICKKGDLIINTMWAWMGALGTSKHNGICSPAYNLYRANKFIDYNHSYFDYLFKIPNFIIEMTKNSKGIVQSRLRLYPTDFFKIKTSLPPLKTQTKIATYLDTQIQKIDKEIELLEKKSLKYKELKQTLINETVLRGLDKSVKFETKRLKDILYLSTGNSIANKEDYESTNIKVYPYVATKDINIDTNEINYENGIYIPQNNNTFKVLKKETTLLCIEGGSAGKKIGFVNQNICSVNKLCAFKSKNNLTNDKFVFYYIKSFLFKNQFFAEMSGLIGGVSIGLIKYFIISLPPLKDQIKIASYLDEKTQKIDAITKTIQTKITLLKEFRKTLINDVVTGKVKI